VLLERKFTDPAYAARRDAAFIVAVGCSDPGGTCFCASMGTGPQPSAGFDLSLTELLGEDGQFLVTVGSDRGADLLRGLARAPATSRDHALASEVISGAVTRMGRHLDTDGIREVLYNNPEHPRWDDVASRCLACANCTLVCPTCFCVSIEDVADLSGDHAECYRVWDSCLTSGHSHLPGGSVRASTRSRYRQWLTHKLASWIDQFGASGCASFEVSEFSDHVTEEHAARSHALHATLGDHQPYLVGPLARYALNAASLSPLARDAAQTAGLADVCRNPFQSIIVRAVELTYACDEALRIVDGWDGAAAPAVDVSPRAGIGHGATEAPRGILYHSYELDADGTILSARIVPPTAQNQISIEHDMRAFVQARLDLPTEELTRQCEQAIRNYDPCISCATHFLDLTVEGL
jgi:ferredoxin